MSETVSIIIHFQAKCHRTDVNGCYAVPAVYDGGSKVIKIECDISEAEDKIKNIYERVMECLQ